MDKKDLEKLIEFAVANNYQKESVLTVLAKFFKSYEKEI